MVPPKSRRQSNLDSTAQAPRARKWIGLKCNRGNPERNVRSDVRLIRYSLCASVRYVAVGPGGMLANWSSIRVEKRRLTEKNKRPVGGESSLRFDDLCERASKVDGCGSRAFAGPVGIFVSLPKHSVRPRFSTTALANFRAAASPASSAFPCRAAATSVPLRPASLPVALWADAQYSQRLVPARVSASSSPSRLPRRPLIKATLNDI